VKKEKVTIYSDSIFFILFSMLLSWTAYNEWLPKHSLISVVQYYFVLRLFFLLIINKKNISISLSSLLVVIFCALSAFWSSYSQLTMSFSINLLIQSLTMMYIAKTFDIKKVIKLLFITGLIICFSSYVVSIFFPSKGIDHGIHVGAWEGVFTQKNNLAEVMAFYFIISLYYSLLVKRFVLKLGIILVGIAEVGLIILSQSSTGLIVLFGTLLPTLIIVLFKRIKSIFLKVSILLYLILISMCVSWILVANLEKLVGLFGKDLTFTGRGVIWEAGENLIKKKWILGYGYRNVSIEGSYFLNYLQSYIGFDIYSLHNGYLETLAYIGVVGSIFVVMSLVIYIVRTYKKLQYGKPLSFLLITFLLYTLIINTQESAFVGSEFALVWCFYVYLQTYLIILNKESKHNIK